MANDERRIVLRRVFRSLLEVARALSEGFALEETLRIIAREACAVVSAKQCSIKLMDETGNRLLTAAAHGLTRAEENQISFDTGQGIAGWVVQKMRTARVDDVSKDPRFQASPRQSFEIRSLMSAPLVSDRGCIGVITVTHDSRRFDEDDEEILELLADAIVVDLEIVRLRHQSYRDPLTDARSRRGLKTALRLSVCSARRDERPLSIMLLDLDQFKRVNDTMGHAFGDLVLRETVQRVREVIRSRDQLFRYGGDELLVIAPGVSLRRARTIAGRIQEKVGSRPFETADGASRLVTVSYGAAALRERDSADGSTTMERADADLLEAKRSRNDR